MPFEEDLAFSKSTGLAEASGMGSDRAVSNSFKPLANQLECQDERQAALIVFRGSYHPPAQYPVKRDLGARRQG